MKEKITYIALILLLSFTSCNRLSAPGQEKQFEDKSYVRLFFNSKKNVWMPNPRTFSSIAINKSIF